MNMVKVEGLFHIVRYIHPIGWFVHVVVACKINFVVTIK